MVDWQGYLDLVCQKYERWWEVYTLTDATRRLPVAESPLLDGLMVESQFSPAPHNNRGGDREGMSDRSEPEEKRQKKVERYGVLEGLKKFVEEHVLLRGRPGSGKSTALARLLLEAAETG